MRDIGQGQKIDIIIQKELLNKIKQSGGTYECDLESDLELRDYIYQYLKRQQQIIDKQNKKIHYKQNIIALLKNDLSSYQHKLYLPPYDTDGKDINDINLRNIMKTNKKEFIIDLYNKYLNIDNNKVLNQNNINIELQKQNEINQEQNKEQQKETSVELNININFNKKDLDSDLILLNTMNILNYDYQNKILISYTSNNNYFMNNYLILYKKDKFVIMDYNCFYLMMIYGSLNGYTVISIFNKKQYGNIINEKILNFIIILAKYVINKTTIDNYKNYIIDTEEYQYVEDNKTDYIDFMKQYNSITNIVTKNEYNLN